MYQQLDEANNHKGSKSQYGGNMALGIHLNDPNGDYDETMSNNDDNCSVKDLSPGTENGSKLSNDPKGYEMRTNYPDNCDIAGQMNKHQYEYLNSNNNAAIRPRNFKDIQSPTENSEGQTYLENMDRTQQGEERLAKESGNGEVGNNLRTYPSSEDLNQTASSEHGGEKITSGSDDEGEGSRSVGWTSSGRK